MKINEAGVDLIKKYESCRLMAYPDPGTNSAPYTIGWGSTISKDGTRFQLGDKITQQEADDLLEWEIGLKADAVLILVKPTVITDNQLASLTSFVYNLGIGNLAKSTLLKKVKVNPADTTISIEFSKWNKSNGKILIGLIKRRSAEAKLYFTV